MRLLISIVILLAQIQCFCQTPIECYLELAKVKEYLVLGDTTSAMSFYENISTNCDQQIGSSHHYNFAKVLQTISAEKAEKEIRRAIDKGMLEWGIKGYPQVDLLQEIKEEYGREILEYAVEKHSSLLGELSKETLEADRSLTHVSSQDIDLRRDKENKICSRYYYNWTNGKLSEKDDNHDELMACSKQIALKDSLNLAIAIALFIENPEMTRDTKATFKWTTPLINHMSSFDFAIDIDSFFLLQIANGNLSPKTYGWYEGEKTEIKKVESKYYYTKKEKDLKAITDKEKIERINKNRREIGLPDIPATVWKHGSN